MPGYRNNHNDFDVIIIGGGPAGSCAALRLLSLGHKIALIEQEIFPREQIGESLSPGIRNILSYLQADHLLDRPEYFPGLPASVIWDTRTVHTINAHQRGPGIMVDRGTLDMDLIQLAVCRGLQIFQPAKFESCLKTDTQWQIQLTHQNTRKTLTSTFVLDARGRKGTSLANRILVAPPTVAMWVQTDASLFQRETLIEAVEDGWLWGSPVVGKQFRIMAFVDPKKIKKMKPPAVFSSLISRSVLFRSAAPFLPVLTIRTCPVLCYSHDTPWEDQYIRLGESAFTLDPLSSTGVEKAMRFSLQAVIAIHTILRSGEALMAKAFYEDRMIESVTTHSRWSSNYYQQAWPKVYTFWKERSQYYLHPSSKKTPFYNKLEAQLKSTQEPVNVPPTEGINMREVLNKLWYREMKLSPNLGFINVPCVIDDHLEIKTAVTHPGLAREMAYVDQVELMPLLAMVSETEIFGELMYKWSRLISFEQAARIGIHLYTLGLFAQIP